MRNIDALRFHPDAFAHVMKPLAIDDQFQTSNTCPDCGKRWVDQTPTPGVLHRTRTCAACAAEPLVIVRLPVRSSNLRSVGYLLTDPGRVPPHGTLDVEFTGSRRVYRYFDVPASVHEQLLAAPSIGTAFATLIKGGGFRYVVLPEIPPAAPGPDLPERLDRAALGFDGGDVQMAALLRTAAVEIRSLRPTVAPTAHISDVERTIEDAQRRAPAGRS